MDYAKYGELPDLLSFDDGRAVETADDWRGRRAELLEHLLSIEYGHLPPAPRATRGQLIYRGRPGSLGGGLWAQYQVSTEDEAGSVQFRLDLAWPDRDGPRPVVINGDGCWRYLTPEVVLAVLGRGYAVAQFSRVEIVPDIGPPSRSLGLHGLYGQAFGGLAAWAWGFHRCVDVVGGLAMIDADRIAVNGHSRGGKAALLAGATDERVALTWANDSGCGGAGCFRIAGPDAEQLPDILRNFPNWFAEGLGAYIGREDELPFDQHALKAAVAPRLLLTTEALGDLWANPRGTWATHAAAGRVYEMLDAGDRIGIAYRQGGHAQTLEDWQAMLDFADWHWKGVEPARGFDFCPFG